MDTGMNHNKKSFLIAGIMMVGIILAVLFCGCIETEKETDAVTNNSAQNTTQDIQTTSSIKEPANITLKVIKFEPARPCSSCTLLGNFAKETIELYFQEEYQSGKISYETVNYQDPNNIELVKKYGVSSSSLIITVIVGDDNEEETIDANDMWRYVGNKEEYMTVFKTKLEGILSEYEDAA